MLGHCADSQTVCRPSPRANFFRLWKLSPTGAFARSHSGLGRLTGGLSSIWISWDAPAITVPILHWRRRIRRNGCGRKSALEWHTHRIEPAADEHLGVSFAAEVPGCGAAGRFQIPLVHRDLHVSALDHKPVDRIGSHDPADFALELFQG